MSKNPNNFANSINKRINEEVINLVRGSDGQTYFSNSPRE